MSQPRIFVSYSHKDRDITQRLVADLHQAGAEVWVDVDGITSGNFIQAIDKALAACEWMVLILSPNALASDYVGEETYTALHRVKQGYMRAVIPVLVTPCVPNSIPPQWDVLQRYDATKDYNAALSGVVRAVGLPIGGRARLEQLGFTWANIDGVDVIIAPVCIIPAGTFLMGSNPAHDNAASEDEMPQHHLTLLAFQIGRFPVTVAEYACFVGSGHPEPHRWQAQLGRLDHPVVSVSWHDAVAYAAWLHGVLASVARFVERTGEVWRLPTEAEWEKAARGTDGRIFPWGDAFDHTQCNTKDSGINTTTPVGTYPTGASPYGVQDMAGNVLQWTSSRYLRYPYKISGEGDDAHTTQNRVLRGGSWGLDARDARSAHRSHMLPDLFGSSGGFRIMKVTFNSRQAARFTGRIAT